MPAEAGIAFNLNVSGGNIKADYDALALCVMSHD